eukprot:TRINITY_DN15423_c0_g1_i1.p1 TRINITY_DN15423_c0_g1~~TRINITY_DN15423_c0_g1_i1.p1  ORF type:complete len:403 (-),score=48.38 TRINITY_DN15423_c0_g1_i1:444-1532(-)
MGRKSGIAKAAFLGLTCDDSDGESSDDGGTSDAYKSRFDRINVSFISAGVSKDGTIGKAELGKWWEANSGMVCNDALLDILFAALDVDGSGAIDVSEFATFILGSSDMQKELKERLRDKEDMLNEIFDKYDERGKGYLKREQLLAFLGKLSRVPYAKGWLDVQILDVNFDAKGRLSRKDFVSWAKAYMFEEILESKVFKQTDRIYECFLDTDEDGNGTISVAELGALLKKLSGSALDEIAVQKIFRSMDKDNSGVIEYIEFVQWVMGNGLLSKMERTFGRPNAGKPVPTPAPCAQKPAAAAPAKHAQAKHAQADAKACSSADVALAAMALPCGWRAVLSKSKGKVYYQHLTGTTQWERPGGD